MYVISAAERVSRGAAKGLGLEGRGRLAVAQKQGVSNRISSSAENKPPIQKEASVKIRVLILLAIASLFLAVTPAVSQLVETKWTADIPFDFVVGSSQMPSGHYTIKSNAQTKHLTVINTDTQKSAFMLTRSLEKLTPDERTVLIFQREADGRHVLHQIWGENNTSGHDVVHGQDVVELTKMK